MWIRKNISALVPFMSLTLIFLTFLFLRTYNLDKRTPFHWDQEQFSTQIYELVKLNKPTLLGPRVVSEKGFFLAPYFTYLLLPIYLLTGLHPIALTYFLVIFNTIFFFTVFYILKMIFSLQLALFFLMMWAINYLLIYYDTIPWWPLTIPLGTILLIYFLFNLQRSGNTNWWMGTGLILGLFINMHFQFIFMFLYSTIFILYSYRHKMKTNVKKYIVLLLSLISTFIPLFLFDIRHNFLNIRLFINFFTHGIDNQPHSFISWWPVFKNVLYPFIFNKVDIFVLSIYMAVLIISVYLFYKKKGFYKSFYFSFSLLWLLIPLTFSLYGRRPSEYYFNFLYPFIIITLIDFCFSIKTKCFLLIYLCVAVLLTHSSIRDQLKTNFLGLYYKDQSVKLLKTYLNNQKYTVTFDTKLGNEYGFRYFLLYYHMQNTNNPTDMNPQIRIPPHPNDILVGKEIGLKIPAELRSK